MERRGLPSPERRRGYAAHCADLLVLLARAIGVLAVANPEAPERSIDVPELPRLLDLVEAALGISLAPPQPYPFYYGLDTDRGVLGERVFNALYAAWRIRQLTAGIAAPRILEIGAGIGRLADYCHRMGLTDYWIVDVPMTSLAQGHFLAHAWGEQRVVLDGEPDAHVRSDAVKIVNPERFFADDRLQFDLVVNCDSLTEVGRDVAARYFRRAAERAPLLFSVNHEVNAYRVHDLQQESRLFDVVDRRPSGCAQATSKRSSGAAGAGALPQSDRRRSAMAIDKLGAGNRRRQHAAIGGERGAAGFERVGQLAAGVERLFEQRHQRAVRRHDAVDELRGLAMALRRFIERRRASRASARCWTISARIGMQAVLELGERRHQAVAPFGEREPVRSKIVGVLGDLSLRRGQRFDLAEQSDLGVEAGDVGGESVGELGCASRVGFGAVDRDYRWPRPSCRGSRARRNLRPRVAQRPEQRDRPRRSGRASRCTLASISRAVMCV